MALRDRRRPCVETGWATVSEYRHVSPQRRAGQPPPRGSQQPAARAGLPCALPRLAERCPELPGPWRAPVDVRPRASRLHCDVAIQLGDEVVAVGVAPRDPVKVDVEATLDLGLVFGFRLDPGARGFVFRVEELRAGTVAKKGPFGFGVNV